MNLFCNIFGEKEYLTYGPYEIQYSPNAPFSGNLAAMPNMYDRKSKH